MDIYRIHHESIDSTNSWAKRQAATFDPEQITLVTATTQTAGRGRFQNKWESPACENLYASFCFCVGNDWAHRGNIPQVMAISTALILKDLGLSPKLKWPNDVLVSKKKIAGILCETMSLPTCTCVILGIGLNANMPQNLLQKLDNPATSLFVETGRKQDVNALLVNLQRSFVGKLDTLLKEGFASFHPLYHQYLVHAVGDPIRFQDAHKEHSGTFHSINPDGSLNLRLSSGTIQNFHSGKIIT